MKKLGWFIIVALSTIISMCSYIAYAAKNTIQCNKDVVRQVLAYPMPHIIARCQKDYHYTNEDMALLEIEFKKYLILAIVHKDSDMGRGMYSRDVDNLWHSFLLFTKEYSAFCRDYAGFFIHHVPEIDEQRSDENLLELQQDFLAFIEIYEKTFHEEIHPIWLLDAYSLNTNTISGEII